MVSETAATVETVLSPPPRRGEPTDVALAAVLGYACSVLALDLRPLILTLAAEFKRREMTEHLPLLRAYWRGYNARAKASQRARMRGAEPVWTEEMVIIWLAIFRIAPFDRMLPVVQREAPCPVCGRERDIYATVNRCDFPGGHVVACRDCHAEWLQLDTGGEGAG